MLLALLLSAIFYRPNLGAWWIAYLFFGSNISRVFHSEISGRWDVFWSLAVEEHFYLMWPIAIRYLRRRSLIILLICALLAEPVIRGLATPHVSFLAIYFLTPFRLDGLAAVKSPGARTRKRARCRPDSFALCTITVRFHRSAGPRHVVRTRV